MNYKDSYIGVLLNAISCVGNALLKGGKHVSISARIGYNSYKNELRFYNIAEAIVDFTFYPLEGWGHCWKAYQSAKEEQFKIDKGFTFGLYVMSIILWIFCIPLSIVFYSYYFLKKLK